MSAGRALENQFWFSFFSRTRKELTAGILWVLQPLHVLEQVLWFLYFQFLFNNRLFGGFAFYWASQKNVLKWVILKVGDCIIPGTWRKVCFSHTTVNEEK